jgi:NADPH-dependent curcumin reductase CurA
MEPVPTPGPGEFVVAVSYLSIDPAMRRWIDTAFREPVMFTGENTDKLVLAVP